MFSGLLLLLRNIEVVNIRGEDVMVRGINAGTDREIEDEANAAGDLSARDDGPDRRCLQFGEIRVFANAKRRSNMDVNIVASRNAKCEGTTKESRMKSSRVVIVAKSVNDGTFMICLGKHWK